MSFEPSSPPDALSSVLYFGPLRLALEHISLDDWKPKYLRFRTERPTQWSSSQVDNAWCEQFEFEPGSAASDMFPTVARFTWGECITISYTWGSLEERETVIINGVPVTVGRNLAAALDRLRSTHRVYKIWVDAVCINQDDVNERTRK